MWIQQWLRSIEVHLSSSSKFKNYLQPQKNILGSFCLPNIEYCGAPSLPYLVIEGWTI